MKKINDKPYVIMKSLILHKKNCRKTVARDFGLISRPMFREGGFIAARVVVALE